MATRASGMKVNEGAGELSKAWRILIIRGRSVDENLERSESGSERDVYIQEVEQERTKTRGWVSFPGWWGCGRKSI
jgi:hypothetical protein